MSLKMEIYDSSYVLLGVLEEFNSLLWEDFSRKAGTFSVEAPLTPTTRAWLRPDHLLWIEGDTAGFIESIGEVVGDSGMSITAKGHLLTGILDRRILWGTYNLSGDTITLMRQLVTDCAISPTQGDDLNARKIPELVLDPSVVSGGLTLRKQKTGGSLLETLEELAEAGQVSFGVRFDPANLKLVFWARPNVNRTVNQTLKEPVLYSTELDDVLAAEYNYDSSEQKNVTLVAGSGQGEERIFVTVEGSAITKVQDPTGGRPSQTSTATKGDVQNSIQSAVLDSWEGSY